MIASTELAAGNPTEAWPLPFRKILAVDDWIDEEIQPNRSQFGQTPL
jgi:hypothetical protein